MQRRNVQQLRRINKMFVRSCDTYRPCTVIFKRKSIAIVEGRHRYGLCYLLSLFHNGRSRALRVRGTSTGPMDECVRSRSWGDVYWIRTVVIQWVLLFVRERLKFYEVIVRFVLGVCLDCLQYFFCILL